MATVAVIYLLTGRTLSHARMVEGIDREEQIGLFQLAIERVQARIQRLTRDATRDSDGQEVVEISHAHIGSAPIHKNNTNDQSSQATDIAGDQGEHANGDSLIPHSPLPLVCRDARVAEPAS